jgi:AraC-like DNA-binding protein
MSEGFVSYSTQVVAPHRRVEFWNERASGVITDLQVQPDRDVAFAASLKAVEFAGIGFAEAISTPSRVVHSHGLASHVPNPCYLIHLQRSGTCLNRQVKTEVLLEAGDFVLCDSTLPCELILGGDNSMLVLRIPQAVLKRRLPTPEIFINQHMPGTIGTSGLVSKFVNLFWDQCQAGMERIASERLADSICDLLATSFLDSLKQPVDGSTVQTLWKLRIRRYIDVHLTDPELSPATIADHFRVSPRYVHKIFATEDEAVSKYILRRRLESCHRSLTDVTQTAKSVSIIAFEWGFNSTTHFARVFRERYGLAPSELRRQHDRVS